MLEGLLIVSIPSSCHLIHTIVVYKLGNNVLCVTTIFAYIQDERTIYYQTRRDDRSTVYSADFFADLYFEECVRQTPAPS